MLTPGLATPSALAWAIAAVIAGLVSRWGPVDPPKDRGAHSAPTPTSGGIGIIAGTCAGLAMATAVLPPSQTGPVTLLLAMAVAVGLLGALDDLIDLGARTKLAVQAVLAMVFALFVARIDSLPLAPGLDLHLWPVVAVLGTALWIVVTVNALNFMDGANGLAPGAAIIILAGLSLLSAAHGQTAIAATALMAAAAGLGFLPWNLPGGRVFQGDAGALFSGFLIAGLAVLAAQPGPSTRPLSAFPVVFACLPLLTDVFLTLLARARRRASLLAAHREHLFQRWLMARPDRTHAALALRFWGLTLLATLIGIAAEQLPQGFQAGILAMSVAASVLIWRIWSQRIA